MCTNLILRKKGGMMHAQVRCGAAHSCLEYYIICMEDIIVKTAVDINFESNREKDDSFFARGA